jgi:hypothetical protein
VFEQPMFCPPIIIFTTSYPIMKTFVIYIRIEFSIYIAREKWSDNGLLIFKHVAVYPN